MRRELSLRGALAILDHYEPGIIGKLDKILGGVILGAGVAVAGGLAPLAIFTALWGWTEQKNQLVELLRSATASLSPKLMRTAGVERRQLIAAAHATIAGTALFEAFSEAIGKERSNQIALSQAEKLSLISPGDQSSLQATFDRLYAAEIPMPTPGCGFEENVDRIANWYGNRIETLLVFLAGLAVTERMHFNWDDIRDRAVERYQSHFLALAAKVPEFFVWAMLGEHAATRAAIAELRSEFATAFDASTTALGRIQTLLALTAASSWQGDQCVALERANRGVLNLPIVPADADRYGTEVTFPAIDEIYINPRYRTAIAGPGTRSGDDGWWESQSRPPEHNIDLTLTAYANSPDATRLPLLLLGHPGAGKSLLTKVFAARLAASGFTVVRVPLRQVGANAPIIDQIQRALDLATNSRVTWPKLSAQSQDRIRVVLLDGLDELLQASNVDRSSYLQEVMEFQRKEADQDQPVIVLVTSRTVVADRVDIPDDTTIVRLEFFDDDEIAEWLRVWRQVNAEHISTGAVRELTLAAARQQAELAKQPLLLLMLALYSADPSFPALDEDLSTADLYERLLDNFARREVRKKANGGLSAAELDSKVADQLDRLAVAALAMFNRGRQDVTEAELGRDLISLHPDAAAAAASVSVEPADLGQRLIAQFFFVHAAEAHLLSRKGEPSRSYEFLHATFGEYLVASRIMNELIDVAAASFGGRRGQREPDDHLLFALLSHQPLVVRRTTLTFAIEILAHLGDAERRQLFDLLDLLIKGHRRRVASDRFSGYRPGPVDRLRELAVYSANLVTLRVALSPEGVPVAEMLPDSPDVLGQWKSIVASWRAGLDADGQQAIASALSLRDDSVYFDRPAIRIMNGTDFDDVLFAMLSDDGRLASRLRFGLALCDESYYLSLPENIHDWTEFQLSWLIPYLLNGENAFTSPVPEHSPDDQDLRRVTQIIARIMASRRMRETVLEEFLDLMTSLPVEIDTNVFHAFVAAAIQHPEVARNYPALRDPASYGRLADIVRLSGAGQELFEHDAEADDLRDWLKAASASGSTEEKVKRIVRQLIESYAGDRRARPIRLSP